MPTFGFFTRVDLEQGLHMKAKKRGETHLSVERLHELECAACPLNDAHNASPKMKPTGPRGARLYLLGEAPGRTEDRRGRQFVGRAGRRLRGALGPARASKARFNNVIRDHPPDNRKPKPTEIECCRPSIVKDIEKVKPAAVFAFGGFASAWFGTSAQISLWRGRYFPARVGDHTCWVFPMYHPSYIDRSEGHRDYKQLERLFQRDIQQAIKTLARLPAPKVWTEEDFRKDLIIVDGHGPDDFSRIQKAFKKLKHSKKIMLDLETVNMRPYSKGSKVLCISFSDRVTTIAIAINHSQSGWSEADLDDVKEEIVNLLLSDVEWIGSHNLLFDLEWITWWLGSKFAHARKWADTMSQAFVLDERSGGFSLDFLALLHLGIRIKQFSVLNKNDLDNEPIEKVLIYCAIDSRAAAEVEACQSRRLRDEGFEEKGTYQFHIQRVPSIVNMQARGMATDQKVMLEVKDAIDPEVEKIQEQIDKDATVEDFRRRWGVFNPNSNSDVVRMFRDMLRMEEGRQEDGSYSVDEEVLEKIKLPISGILLKWREFTKLRGFVSRMDASAKDTHVYPDGLIHSIFKHTGTSTQRLASEDPNMTNVPKRRHKEVRRGFVPRSSSNLLLAVDFGQIQWRAIVNASKDKMCTDFLLRREDIHTFWAERIAKAYREVLKRHIRTGERYASLKTDVDLNKVVMKRFRDAVKNEWTFPKCFLASRGRISRELHIPEPVLDPIHDEFEELLAGVTEWQNRMVAFYDKHGYVETPTGGRRHGPMSRNMIVNSPIQGIEAAVVMDAMNRMSLMADQQNRPELQPILNIHDDLTFDVPKKRLDETAETAIYTMLDCPFPWWTVPLSVEASTGPNWMDMKEFGKFFSDDVVVR